MAELEGGLEHELVGASEGGWEDNGREGDAVGEWEEDELVG